MLRAASVGVAYLVSRWEGCIAFNRAYAASGEGPIRVELDEAMRRVHRIQGLFRDRPGNAMANPERLGTGVQHLPHFLDRWDAIGRRWVGVRPYFDVVWEHYSRYETCLRQRARGRLRASGGGGREWRRSGQTATFHDTWTIPAPGESPIVSGGLCEIGPGKLGFFQLLRLEK